MDKNLKGINREIREGKNLEMNLPMFLSDMATVYCRYAMLQLTMQYPSYFEAVKDGDIVLSEEDRRMLETLNTLIKDNILEVFGDGSDGNGAAEEEFSGIYGHDGIDGIDVAGGYDSAAQEEAIRQVDGLRRKTTGRMAVLTAYTDRFALKEYILNRLEYRYQEIPEYKGDDDTSREILIEIFDGDDNAIVNEKIRMMLSQLPVRMTKAKFFEYLDESFEAYAGQDVGAVESYLYMLKSAAGIYEPEGFSEEFTELKELLDELDSAEFNELTDKQFEALNAKLEEGTDFLNNEADIYFGLQELINSLYAALLLYPYADNPDKEERKAGLKILKIINEGFTAVLNGNDLEEEEDAVENDTSAELFVLEGKVENLLVEVPSYEAVLETIAGSHQKLLASMMLDKLYNRLLMAQRLLANSTFADVVPQEKTERADVGYLDKVKKDLSQDLSLRLEAGGKYGNRAMIAAVLKEMPVFFSSRSEVMDYVRGSLAGCRDLAEKTASLKLLNDLFSEFA